MGLWLAMAGYRPVKVGLRLKISLAGRISPPPFFCTTFVFCAPYWQLTINEALSAYSVSSAMHSNLA